MAECLESQALGGSAAPEVIRQLMKAHMLIRPLALALCLVTTVAHAQPAADPKADEAAIRAARIVQTQAIAKDDLDTVVKYWVPDITIRRALGQPVDGAAAARKLLEPVAGATTRVIYQRETVSVEASANWPLAYEEGRWSGHVDDVRSPAIFGGRYSAQWVKRDGQWLIRSEVFVALTCTGAGCKAAAVP